ncbi:hypothetical protein FOPG_11832 [Fusarium oxysporum f. sp. conglutinans race 2 54008]|uniref:Uncharacterized protein n=2 Tax=Fusarium oxysporum TaxID=5507 RepID=X0HLG0_FUSOX|nr:hypothetical protein FOVG_11816 [Fusarium oxysporum f. sp. pisi HDV247]EXL72681.1 hypothetical protein FOPG_11832 [Fusarium oxysporum f. sp. conglutinans race 2 54008]KAI8407204.1 hypothetical protein FOFC_12639 [Fusarium oxysporum]
MPSCTPRSNARTNEKHNSALTSFSSRLTNVSCPTILLCCPSQPFISSRQYQLRLTPDSHRKIQSRLRRDDSASCWAAPSCTEKRLGVRTTEQVHNYVYCHIEIEYPLAARPALH